MLSGHAVILFVDNNAVFGAIAKGRTAGNLSRSCIADIWAVDVALSITRWFERVPPASNLGDLPTRLRTPGYPVRINAPFISLVEWAGYNNLNPPPPDFLSIVYKQTRLNLIGLIPDPRHFGFSFIGCELTPGI